MLIIHPLVFPPPLVLIFEHVCVQEVRTELSRLMKAFREKSNSLSDRLAEAASERAALEASRASVEKSHAEGIR